VYTALLAVMFILVPLLLSLTVLLLALVDER
jgi:hypothetical protein